MPSKNKKASLLVVDDDIRMLRLMHRILELEGYRVLATPDGQAALEVLDEEMPDLVLLDILMPGMDGYTVCQRIREFSQIPIVMVTAKGNDEEKVQGLDVGADDYVTKPFSARELAARIRAVLRRSQMADEPSKPIFRSGNLTIHLAKRRVTLGGREVNLTATEYQLLSFLVRNAGRVVTADQTLEKVWGEQYIGESHLLQVTMARLRHKLCDDARNSRYILTKPGIGYMMVEQS